MPPTNNSHSKPPRPRQTEPNPSSTTEMLTPSEIESLREEMREAAESAREILQRLKRAKGDAAG